MAGGIEHRGPAGLILAAIALIVTAIAFAGEALADSSRVVSRQSRSAGGAIADGNSETSAISPDGRFVAFETRAQNLGGPVEDTQNIYLYDVRDRRVELVSRDRGMGADGPSFDPSVSKGGRYVAYTSVAQNLRGRGAQVYVYDAKTSRSRLVSRQSERRGGRPSNNESATGQISADGNTVVFSSLATNLSDDVRALRNTYAYDVERKRVELVSRRSDGGAGGDKGSTGPTFVSARGRFVAFTSRAENLGGRSDGIFRPYVYDRRRDRVRLVAPRIVRSRGFGYAFSSSISDDGGRVGLYANGNRDDTGGFAFDLGSERLIRAGEDGPDLSKTGRFAAGERMKTRRVDGTRVEYLQVIRYDLASGRKRVVSRDLQRPPGEGGLRSAFDPSISADGSAISFTDAVPEDDDRRGTDLIYRVKLGSRG